MKYLFSCLFSLSFLTSFAQDNKDAIGQVRNMAKSLLTLSHIPGLSIAVLQNGKVVYAEGFGYADIDKQTRVTTNTQFRTASVAKVITATALGVLLQQSKISLDEEIHHYLPSFPAKTFPITIRQLAGHLSGLPHYNDSDRLEHRFYTTAKDGLRVFEHESLLTEPGTAYRYSTHGFTLLTAAIESVTGMSYLDFLTSQILKPLGMIHTGPDMRSKPSTDLATYYALSPTGPKKVINPEDPSYKWGGGGLISTPIDLVTMANAYFNGKLHKNIVDTLFCSQKLANGIETLVGIGWRISQDIEGRNVRDHAGSMQGARSVITLYPDQQLAIAVMVNAEWSSMIEETAQMLALPFLSNKEAFTGLSGQYHLRVSMKNAKNEEITTEGSITFDGATGSFQTNAGFANVQTMPIYLIGNRRYAWIRPDGICYLEIKNENGQLTGKAIAFGSRLNKNPLTNPPFLTLMAN